jgi:DNA-directed RNA polymerase beta subunit
VKAIPAQELSVGDLHKTKLSWWLEAVVVGQPTKNDGSSSKQLLPRECRERGMVYGAPMTGTFKYSVDDGEPIRLER